MGGYSSFEAQAGAKACESEALVIRRDQQSLRALGYYRGALEGVDGPATTQAIVTFRAANGLGESPELDDDARSRLDACVQARQAAATSPKTATTDPCCIAGNRECSKAVTATR